MEKLHKSKTLTKITGDMRRAIQTFDMILDGEHVAVAVSGGKDSIALLVGLANLQKYSPIKFSLSAITVDIGFPTSNPSRFDDIEKLCTGYSIPFYLVKTNIYDVVFNIRKEPNPCSLCANMRRGALNAECVKIGATKLALGHHKDDFVDTFIMSLFQENRLFTLQPVSYMDRMKITLIRPLIYVEEATIKTLTDELHLPTVSNPCPLDKTSMRQKIKDTISTLSIDFPNIRTSIFSAITHPERLMIVNANKKED
ncbi:MAG TPA: ATP-binding protein [Clostridia bacterium]|jgi:tRNA(Ile)-lysidine synthetase-like protein|nr:ATP-binding protein [Clostridia bacterium]